MPRLCSERTYNDKLDLKIREVFKDRNCARVFLGQLRRIQPQVLSDDILANIDKKLNLNYLGAGNDEILDALKCKSKWFEIITKVLSDPKHCQQDLGVELIRLKEELDAEIKTENEKHSLPSTSPDIPPGTSNNITQGGARKRKTSQDSKTKSLKKLKKGLACDYCVPVVKAMSAAVKPDDKGRCIVMWSAFRTRVLNVKKLKKWAQKNLNEPFSSKKEKYNVACKEFGDCLANPQRVDKPQGTPLCVQKEIKKFFGFPKNRKRKLDAEIKTGNANHALPSTSSDIPPETSNNTHQEETGDGNIPKDSKPKALKKKKKAVDESKEHPCNCDSAVKSIGDNVKPLDVGRCITKWFSFRIKVLNLTKLKKWNDVFFEGPFSSKKDKSTVAFMVYDYWLATTQRADKAQETPLCVTQGIKKFFVGSKKGKPKLDAEIKTGTINRSRPSTSNKISQVVARKGTNQQKSKAISLKKLTNRKNQQKSKAISLKKLTNRTNQQKSKAISLKKLTNRTNQQKSKAISLENLTNIANQQKSKAISLKKLTNRTNQQKSKAISLKNLTNITNQQKSKAITLKKLTIRTNQQKSKTKSLKKLTNRTNQQKSKAISLKNLTNRTNQQKSKAISLKKLTNRTNQQKSKAISLKKLTIRTNQQKSKAKSLKKLTNRTNQQKSKAKSLKKLTIRTNQQKSKAKSLKKLTNRTNQQKSKAKSLKKLTKKTNQPKSKSKSTS